MVARKHGEGLQSGIAVTVAEWMPGRSGGWLASWFHWGKLERGHCSKSWETGIVQVRAGLRSSILGQM